MKNKTTELRRVRHQTKIKPIKDGHKF